ncbi:hypothetical protein [Actinomadura kijaniata]|uniref:hypothetical protein n=1 Tax=Actinomadura kijaniata TaxID=46161 RepID=UPI00083123DF|nr:hypothetical protein [Actinomadura kijaniata]
MPTHEWTLSHDPHGRDGRRRNRRALLIAVAVPSLIALVALVPALTGEGPPRPGGRTYNAQVDCQVNTVNGAGTVSVNGTIEGDSSRYQVTVEVLDAATRQSIGQQTFDVRDTRTFGGSTPARTPPGPAGIECRITKVV